MKNYLICLVENIHLKIFKHPIGSEMRGFLGNLSWSFLGGGLAAAVIMAINIIAGRLMGPVDYGRYNLVVVICNYLFIPIFFGLDLASVMAIARGKNDKEKGQYISSSLVFITISTFVVLGLVLLFQNSFSKLFSTDNLLIKFSTLFALCMVFKMATDGYIRGISEFKLQFWGRIIESLGIIVVFVILFLLFKKNVYSSYVLTLVFGSILVTTFYLSKIKSYLGAFSYPKLIEQLAYGKLFLLATTLGTIFVSMDKIIINKYIGPHELGLYGAYYTASFTLVTQMAQMFNNVFFPTIAKNLNKVIFAKIEKLVYISFVPILVIITSFVFLIIKLYGSKYQVQFDYVLIFGFLGAIQIIQTIYNSVIMNLSKSFYKKYLLQYNLLNLLTVVSYAFLIFNHSVHILSIALILTLNYIILVFMQRKLIKDSF